MSIDRSTSQSEFALCINFVMKTFQLHILTDAILREMYVIQREIPVFDGINYRVEHNLENDVGRSKGATLMRDARVNWFMLPFPLSSTLVSA